MDIFFCLYELYTVSRNKFVKNELMNLAPLTVVLELVVCGNLRTNFVAVLL